MNPFQASLGAALDALPGPLRDHFALASGSKAYEGVMTRVWRKGGLAGWLAFPALWMGRRLDLLFTDTGMEVPFRLENRVWMAPDGTLRMDWVRQFRFPDGVRRFSAVMRFEPGRGIVDDLGRRGILEAELHPRVEGRLLALHSGRQWVRVAGLRVPLPALLAGEARVREWMIDDQTFGIRVEVWSPLLGCLFGYEGSFREVPHA